MDVFLLGLEDDQCLSQFAVVTECLITDVWNDDELSIHFDACNCKK